MPKNNWTREETIIAFNVYCKIPFKNSSKNHPMIIEYAKIINRSPSALNMKIGNFGRLDPELKKQGITGLAHGSKIEEVVWEEFNKDWESLTYESEALIAKFQNKTIYQNFGEDLHTIKEGKEKERIVKTRVNQSFFRSTILSSYNQKCCITGINIPDLLIASHIIPWSKMNEHRLNPRNGLCLNALHDKAFDKGYITVSTDFKVKISTYLRELEKDENIIKYFLSFEDKDILLPERFLPSKEILEYHMNNIFIQ
jgi:putative restriction endonuclease